ncbi:TlpA disulfide reductase family protein [Candidatus Kapabacteria bacterium]|nr:TlpA disulfide reductase family protein [Candidatus Kapabacteria bacterium]
MKYLILLSIIIFLLSCDNSLKETNITVNSNQKIIETVSFNSNQSVEIDQQIPNFYMNPSSDLEMDLRDFRGKVLMLQFDASWCSICKSVAPKISEASNILDTANFAIIKIYDAYYDISDFIEAASLYQSNYYNVQNGTIDGFDLTSLYNVKSFPRSLIVDKNGILREIRSTSSLDIVETMKKYQ